MFTISCAFRICPLARYAAPPLLSLPSELIPSLDRISGKKPQKLSARFTGPITSYEADED